MFNDPTFDRERRDANMELLNILIKLVTDNPDQRFSQILQNYGFISNNDSVEDPTSWRNEFYAEPMGILKRVQDKIKK